MIKFHKIKEQELLKFQNLFNSEDIILPKRQTSGSCGYDFYLPYDLLIKANSNAVIYSGVKIELDNDLFLMVCIRSSLATKKGIILTNQVGIIDGDYYNNVDNDGHIMIAVKNTTDDDVLLKKGERVAQGIIFNFLKTNDDDVSASRVGGFGSTTK